MNFVFYERIFEKLLISDFMEFRPVGGRTVMTKLIVAFRKSAKAPENLPVVHRTEHRFFMFD